MGEEVGGAFVHGEEDFGGADAGGEVGERLQGATPRGHGEKIMILNAESEGVVGVEIEEEEFWIEFTKDSALVGAGLGVPLGARAPSGEEGERVFPASGLGQRRWGIEEEFGALIGSEEFVVFEETAFLRNMERGRLALHLFRVFAGLEARAPYFWQRPLDAAGFVEVLVAFDPGDVAGLPFGELLKEFEGGGWARPFFEHFSAAPGVGEELNDAEVTKSLAGGVSDLLDRADAAFAVDEGAGFFTPGGGGEEEVGSLGGLGGVIHVLHHEKV